MLKGLVYAIISAICYATLPVFAKMGGYDVGLTAVQMLTYRFSIGGAAALAVFFLLFRRKALIPTPKLLLKCAGLGIGLYMIQSMFFYQCRQIHTCIHNSSAAISVSACSAHPVHSLFKDKVPIRIPLICYTDNAGVLFCFLRCI